MSQARIGEQSAVVSKTRIFFSLLSAAVFVASCTLADQSTRLLIDGSSTVYPLTEAIAEEFRGIRPDIRVGVGISGTGGGFKKLLRGQTTVSEASRPITEFEASVASQEGVDYIELPVAYDGIVVVVNPRNDWCDELSVSELRRLWGRASQGRLKRWKQIRPDWPDLPIKLFGPGVASGTYDYFTSAIIGEAGGSRGDYTASEDDNVLVTGVAGDTYALGFFGFPYYERNKESLKLVAIRNQGSSAGGGPVLPGIQTVFDGSYQPLSRPVFLYLGEEAARRPEVAAFIEYYLERAPFLAPELGYIPLPREIYDMVRLRFRERRTGTVFVDRRSRIGVSIAELIAAESTG